MRNTLHNLLRRRGSVLILVVALLVLLALAGTAYLATVRVDRTSTGISTSIAETDLLMESAKLLVQQQLLNDLPHYLRADGTPSADAEAWDHPNTDKWLGDRVPAFFTPVTPPGFPVWRFASDISGATGTAYRFDSPYASGYTVMPGEKNAYLLRPTTYTVGTASVPAIQLYSSGAPVFDPQPAADADGDGIPDAPYFRLPSGRIGDLTYFIGVRIIDNAAAINVNTAWDRDFDYTVGTSTTEMRHYGMFAGNVGLAQMLADYTVNTGSSAAELGNLTRYRLGFPYSGSTNSNILPHDDYDLSFLSGTDRTPSERTDLVFQSTADALWQQMSRRIDTPGHRNATTRFRSYPITEMMAMGYRFCLTNPNTPASMLEAAAPTAGTNYRPWSMTTTASGKSSTPYGFTATDIETWFKENFDYENEVAGNSGRRPMRSLLVTHNGVGNLAPLHADSATGNVPTPIATLPIDDPNTLDTDDYRFETYRDGAVTRALPAPRASINTGTFGELWRAFWSVMHDATPSQVPTGTETRMFRFEHSTLASAHEQLVLRAALAAVNAEDLRDFDDDVTEHTIKIGDKTINVYGTEKQPFISEALVALGGATGTTDDWIGVELYLPHLKIDRDTPTTALTLKNWQLAAFDRTTGTLTKIYSFDTETIAPRGFLTVISGPTLPLNVTAPTGTVVTTDKLLNAIGKELVLLRPRARTGTASGGEPAAVAADADMVKFVPADQLDFAGMSTEPADPAAPVVLERWHYARIAPSAATATADAWKCVYPGPHATAGNPTKRGFKGPDDATAGNGTLSAENTAATFVPSYIIPLNDYQWPGPRYTNGVPATTEKAAFPYGGFARNGDILMVPFIGGYKVVDGTGKVTMNSVTYDAAYAEAAEDVANSLPDENAILGRFAPLGTDGTAVTGYEWAEDLFQHLTAHQNPGSDALPNMNRNTYVKLRDPANANTPQNSALVPQPVANGPVSLVRDANTDAEQGLPTHGLVNINTAPVPVLNMVLWKIGLDPSGPTAAERQAHEDDNKAIAGAVWLGQMAQPYKTPLDILRHPEVRALHPTPASGINPTTTDLDETHGDVTPFETAALLGDGVLDDFEQHYLPFTRISNLITTRSDSFTVYIVLEGWKDAGTANATRVTQRRAAFIVDRSGYTPLNPRLNITNIPTE